MDTQVEELKRNQRAMWASGDYPSIAERIAAVGEAVVEAAEIEPDMDVLDVAAGAGNASIPAAARGARVVASDLTPELFEAGRRTAAERGVELEWVEADAEHLPFDDASFDRVLSTFGAMFAPRHQRTADELARVCRPGGLVAMANWTLEGAAGRMFGVIGGYMPPPPDFVERPPMWGNEDHVRELFEPHGLDLRLERRMVRLTDESAVAYVDYMAERFGPMMGARRALEPEGRWEQLREELAGVFESTQVEDGSAPFAWDMEYLLVLGRKPD
jgi:ubiquinone/menaquinone biosynthesis C-methylase UbiE